MKWKLALSVVVVTFALLRTCSVAALASDDPKASSIESIGIYNCYTGLPAEAISFFRACGYNTYQRWDAGWLVSPTKHERYYAEMTEDVRRMQRAGFKAFVLLSVNLRQRSDGDAAAAGPYEFDPNDAGLMQERLNYLTAAVAKLKMADGFTICAGDPGGHRRASVGQFYDVTKKMVAIIQKEVPKAAIDVNSWGIAAWDAFPSPFDLTYWERETRFSRELARLDGLVGPLVNVEFPLHGYYRPLVMKCYADAGKTPELYPTAQEVAALKNRGVKRLWGWPYFLTDKCDDGYQPGTAGIAQSETRYIKQIVDTARRIGLNGMIANAMEGNIFGKSLNLYAFGRFCKDPAVTPEKVVDEFAGFLCEPESAGELSLVIRYVENLSTWQAGMPQKFRLPDFETGGLKSAQNALDLLAKIRPRSASALPMSKPPAEYLRRLKQRLEVLTREKAAK